MLRETEMANREGDPFELEFFNTYETCAQKMLRDTLLSDTSRAANHPPHLLILGLGQLGETLAVHAAREWKKVTGGGKLRITVFDRSAKAKQEPFTLLYPEVGDAADVLFHQLDVRQPQFTKGTSLHQIEGWQELTAAYVCLGHDTLGVCAGLALVKILKPRRVPIIVRMSERAGLATALRAHKTDPGFVDGLQAVGLVELTCKAELVLGDTEATALGTGRG
jgi:hypothetical protein